MKKPHAFSVTALNAYLKDMFSMDAVLSSVFVSGEIANFKPHSSGHMYFSLKDENATLPCVMFKSYAQMSTFEPENGMDVLVSGYVSVYEKTGQVQLYCEYIEPLGVGSLAKAFEQLKKRLSDEGLFAPEHKKSVPPYPKRIAVVTSGDGAALRDIMRIAKRRNPTVQLLVTPVSVQGQTAPDEIAQALKDINVWSKSGGNVDLVIVGRGGGSIEDLWAFNTEIVARAIYASEIPVISAVGHETDYTIADFVADLRVSTPSAAAEIAIPLYIDIRQFVLRTISALNRGISGRLAEERAYINDNLERMSGEIDRRIKECRKILALRTELLSKVSPLHILSKGYALLGEDGKPILSANGLHADQNITITMHDGTASATIDEVKVGKINQ